MEYVHELFVNKDYFVQVLEPCDELVQWSYGQILRIRNLDLPIATQVHFSLSETAGETQTVIAVNKGDHADVKIPREIFEKETITDYKAYAFIYLSDKEHGETIYKIVLSVRARPKPSEKPVVPDNPDPFAEVIEVVNSSAKRAEQASIAAKGYAEKTEIYGQQVGDDAAEIRAHREDVDKKAAEVEQNRQGAESSVKQVLEAENRINKTKDDIVLIAEGTKQDSEEVRQNKETVIKAEEAVKKYADKTEQDKNQTEKNKNEVVEAVNGFDAKVNESVESIVKTGTEQAGAVEQVGIQQTQAVKDAGAKQVQAVTDEGVKQKQELQKETELFKGDREQIVKNKDDILKFAIKPEASGNPIVLKDSADFPILSLELNGSTTQVQTSGKNLFNPKKIITPMIVSSGGEIVTEKGSYSFYIKVKNRDIFMYSQKADFHTIRYAFFEEEPTVSAFSIDKKMKEIATLEPIQIEIVDERINWLLISFYRSTSLGTLENTVNSIMFEKGSTATPYEPYSGGLPSPSPNYPQEIKQREWNNVSCTGDNLFNKQTIVQGILEIDGTIKETNTEYYTSEFIPVNSNVEYSLGRTGSTRLKYYDKNKEPLNNMSWDKQTDGNTNLYPPKEANFVRFTVYTKGTINSLMFNVGKKEMPYSDFKGFIETLPQKIQLSEWDKIKLIDGVWKVERNSKKLKVDNTLVFEKWNENVFLNRSSFLKDCVYTEYNDPTVKVYSNYFKRVINVNSRLTGNGEMVINNTGLNISWITFGAKFNTVEEFTAFLSKNDVYLIFPTAVPTYEPLPQPTQDLLNKITTFYPNTVLQTNEGITFDLKYVADTKNYIDNKFIELQEQLAGTQEFML